MEDNLIFILEDFSPDVKPTLWEGNGGWNLKFKFGESDVKNLNSRLYPHKVLSAAVAVAQEKISQGLSVYGSADHVDRLGIADISHRLTSLKMEGKNAMCECALLKTDRGNNVRAILAGKGSLGCSMRGEGTVSEKGEVQADYKLLGVDLCISPSFSTFVSAKNFFSEELSPAGDPENLSRRWEQAVKAGYRGSKVEYTQAISKSVDRKELDRLFQQALLSGFAGSYEDYRDKIYLRRK